MKYKPFLEHILEIFVLSSNTAKDEGSNWYNDAHDFALSLDENVERSAGVIASMSPLNGWANNKRCAYEVYCGTTTGLSLKKNEAKAVRILNGEKPLDVLGGSKVRAFYSTILDPTNPDSTPVIDRHAHDIAIGAKVHNKHPSRNMTEKRYEEFAETYRECARLIGLGAPQLQAITWLAWREKHKLEWYG